MNEEYGLRTVSRSFFYSLYESSLGSSRSSFPSSDEMAFNTVVPLGKSDDFRSALYEAIISLDSPAHDYANIFDIDHAEKTVNEQKWTNVKTSAYSATNILQWNVDQRRPEIIVSKGTRQDNFDRHTMHDFRDLTDKIVSIVSSLPAQNRG